MNALGVVVRHGWGFDARSLAQLVQDLRERMPADTEIVIDELGFLGAPKIIASRDARTRWIAVGHSFGFASLLTEQTRWIAAIALGGFLRFPQNGLAAMRTAFARQPAATLQAFYRRCDMTQAPTTPEPLEPSARARLTAALDSLATFDLDAPEIPMLFLAGARDRIVPPMQSSELADMHPPGARYDVAHHPTAGHALGIDESAWCGERAREFLKSSIDA